MEEKKAPGKASDSASEDHSYQARGPLGIELPANADIMRQARILIGDKDLRVSALSEIISRDPVASLKLIKVANATFYSGDRPPIANVSAAIIRLGAGALVQTFDDLQSRPALTPASVAVQFELLRALSAQVSSVSQIIAQVAARDMVESAQTAGLFSYMGHLVACAYLGERYVEICTSRQYASLAYRLNQDYNFDVRAVQLAYLKMRGVPQELFYALDRDLPCKNAYQALLRFCVQSAVELVEAAHCGRWERYAPGNALPSKSSLRLLKILPSQYTELYKLLSDFLKPEGKEETTGKNTPRLRAAQVEEETPVREPVRNIEQKKTKQEAVSTPTGGAARAPSPTTKENEQALRKTSALGFLQLTDTQYQEVYKSVSEYLHTPEAIKPLLTSAGAATELFSNEPNSERINSGFQATSSVLKQEPNYLSNTRQNVQDDASSLSLEGQKTIELIQEICNNCKRTQDLLSQVMSLLIEQGPYARAALLTLAQEQQTATVHTAIGPGFDAGEKINVADPLSPIALCLTKIHSFNAPGVYDALSPFGITSYAVSPVMVNKTQPAVLYADCGNEKSLPLEARKVFRLVVGLLNEILPELPDGLPDGQADILEQELNKL